MDFNPKLAEVFAGLDPARLRCVVGDVTLEATALKMTSVAVEAFGRIDVMVCNAGIAVIGAIAEIEPADWDRVMDVNVKSIYWAARAVVPVMRAQGGGVFLLTGSISSVCGMELQGVYGPFEGGGDPDHAQMAIDYAKDGIRVNAVCPGWSTRCSCGKRRSIRATPGVSARAVGLDPIGRVAGPEEIAKFFQFLASDDARFFTDRP